MTYRAAIEEEKVPEVPTVIDRTRVRAVLGFLEAVATAAVRDAGDVLPHLARGVLDAVPAAVQVAIHLVDAPGDARMAHLPRLVVPRSWGAAPRIDPLSDERHLAARLSAAATSPCVEMPPGFPIAYAAMAHAGCLLGVLAVEYGAPLEPLDVDAIGAMAAAAAMALENLRLRKEAYAEHRLHLDLLLAAQIQQRFLPHQFPRAPGLAFVTEYRPAGAVGGDFYDVYWLDADRIAMFVGDVSGKGVPAAILMAYIAGELRGASLAEADPARAMARVNRTLLERREHEIFVTAVYLVLDVKTRRITLSNAGHPPPFVRHGHGHGSAGALERVDGGMSTALGIFDDTAFATTSLCIAPGDSVVLYSDGILEAADAEGQHFGAERLASSLGGGSDAATGLAERLLDDLRAWVGEAPQSDDITLLVCSLDARAGGATGLA